MDVSNSEFETFLRCKRRWDFESPNRMNLRARHPVPHLAFYVGEIAHRILEAQVILGRRPDIDAIINEQERLAEERYEAIVGAGWSNEEREPIEQSRHLVSAIMNHYFNHHGDVNPLGMDFRYIQAEVTFRVPIPGTEHHLIGTIDGIAEHVSGEVYLVEHKTTSVGFPKPEELQVSRQLHAYTWAANKLLGRPVSGVVYDGILKKEPSIPHVLKDGTLSHAPIATTPRIFKQAIQIMGLKEEDYVDVLAKLKEDYFFRRYVIRFPQRSLQAFEEQARAMVLDMANPNTPLYPNIPWQGCWDCRYRDLCTAMQLGEDTAPILEMNYQQAELAPSRRKEAITSLELGKEYDI